MIVPDIEHIKSLLTRIQTNTASEDELEELLAILRSELPEEIIYQINEFHAKTAPMPPLELPGFDYWERAAAAILNVDKEIQVIPITRQTRWQHKAWLKYAAAIIVLFGIGLSVWLIEKKSTLQISRDQPVKINDAEPGHNGAILTLADGTTILLDSMKNGEIGKQDGASLLLGNGQLVYNPSGNKATGIAYNSMITPRGRQFNLHLSDGTEVWLNAGSSIRYPTRFTGKTREVEISGEVYFEVAKKDKQPFIVKLPDQSAIEVLGTHFNINAYKDEPYSTTSLLEGAIRLHVNGQNRLLKPGQQALVQAGSVINVQDKSNIVQAIAWKNGLFNLEDRSIAEIMRQVERWYDVEVRFEGKIPEVRFKGEIDQGVRLSELLKFFEESAIPVNLENGILTVSASED